MTIAINGFGRIGRTAFRIWWDRFRHEHKLAVINTSGSSDLEMWAYLLKFDSNYGVWPYEIKTHVQRKKDEVTDEQPELGVLEIDGVQIVVTAQKDPAKIPWAKYGVETVIESTGVFTTQEKASLHLQGGAKRVILSAPAKGEGVETTVLGVSPENMSVVQVGAVVSNASCTTNCVAPITAIMHSVFGVKKAGLTTVHAYTDDQNLHDNSHKDMRRARAAAQNIVPTTTGAARVVGTVVPELKGLFDGLAIRVPVATGSISDMTFVLSRPTTVEEVNAVLTEASKSERWKGIVAVTSDQLVSRDIVGRPESSIVDLSLTQVIGGDLVKVISWYDNEFGYCNRLVELAVGA